MKDYFLEKTALFRGMEADEIREMLKCLSAEQKHYLKGAMVYHAGDMVQFLSLIHI